MSKYKIITAVLVVCITSNSFSMQKTIEMVNREIKIHKMKQTAKRQQADIKFYGRVVDQFDNPVADANVIAGIENYDYFQTGKPKEVIVLTDSNGSFEVEDYGRSIIITEIEKEGYEFEFENNPTGSFDYWAHLEKNIFVPNKNQPVTFYLRKKGEPAYLLADYSSWSRNIEPNEAKNWEFYIFKQRWIDENFQYGRMPGNRHFKRTYEYRRGPADFRIDGRPAEDGFYQLCFTPLWPDSGAIASDEMLYEAPESGYEPNAVIYIDSNQFNAEKQYVYLKIEGGNFYSRIEIKPSGYTDRIVVYYRRFTNPSGSRNLEYDSEYNRKIKQYREEEFKKQRKLERQQRERLEKQNQK